MMPGYCLPAGETILSAAQHNKTINPPTANTNMHVHTGDVHMHAHVHNIPHPHIYVYGLTHSAVGDNRHDFFYTVIKGQVRAEVN